MSIKKIKKADFEKLIDKLISSQNVYGPVAYKDKFKYEQLSIADQLRLDHDVTALPPKKYFLPPAETILTFEVNGAYQSQYDTEQFVLVGVHPYDMVAINQMDELFRQDNYDNHYMTRRNNATIIACDVVTASKNVFASSVGTATVDEGYDILLTDIGDSYMMDVATDKGQSLLASAAGVTDAGDEDIKKREKVHQKNLRELNKHDLKCKVSDLPGLLKKSYDNEVWEEKAKTCFACGSCNQVCPTCYCFNVQDDVSWDLQKGQRNRAWDGCLLAGFTKVAGDHEFRKNKADRFRHRLYRKGMYVPEKIGGQIACVGCGRCINACLPDIANPVNVYNKLVEEIGID